MLEKRRKKSETEKTTEFGLLTQLATDVTNEKIRLKEVRRL